MSSHLWKLEKEYKEGTGADRMLAQGMNIGSHDPDKVIVYLMSEPGTRVDGTALSNLGAQIIKGVDNLTKAEVPIDMLTTIADTVNGISFIKTPDRLIPVAVTSEGVNLTGANTFHNAGYTGSGVKVAVIDVGFSGLSSAISAGELPGNVVKVDCTGASCTSSSFSDETEPHGTAVAEIVYDMAPGASLYLIKVTDTIDLVDAKDFAVNNGIRIINFSLVVPNTNFYDGECYNSNPVCTADDAYFNNILWVNAAGNEAQRHYEAVFADTDTVPNRLHNVYGNRETINISADDGDTIEVYLTWNAWPTTDQDYDLYLYNGSNTLVASSTVSQTGSQPPTENIIYSVPAPGGGGTYYLSILKKSASSNHLLEVYSIYHNLSDAVASSSLLGPADAAGAMAVGAINYNNWTTGPQEPYSSQGPTNDGFTIKPDIMGPDNVSSDVYASGFTGTSASSAHVVGAAALILHKFPGISVEQLWDFLISTAIDMGIDRKDNIYGHGRLNLDINAAIPSSIAATSSGGGGGGCFIATAAYGSYAAPCVQILRKVRDRFLLTNTIGKSFVNMYYKYSPPLADFIADHNNLKVFVQLGLLPLVGISWLALKFGPVPTTMLMIVFVLGLIRLVLKGTSPVNGKTLPNGTK
ncbi:MAG: CFI-box-CTERM domain-containing protein [Desulfobacterales bacterium]